MIVNFAVKEQGLEAQLLNTVVKCERPDLDKQKNDLVVTVAQGKRTQVGSSVRPRLHANPDCSHAALYPQCGWLQAIDRTKASASWGGIAQHLLSVQSKRGNRLHRPDPKQATPLVDLGTPQCHPNMPLAEEAHCARLAVASAALKCLFMAEHMPAL